MEDYFTPYPDDHQNGEIIYPLKDLEDGLHTITLKAWDVYNNPSEATISFFVSVDGQIEIEEAYNYPNPFTNTTTFKFHHNKPGNVFDIEINIYNILGQRVSNLGSELSSNGNMVAEIEWDGRGNSGELLGGGVYIYTLKVTDQQGTTRQFSQRLIISR